MKKHISKIYIFGNQILDFDNTPILLQAELEKIFPTINFIHQDPNENLSLENNELVLIDTVEGINEVKILTDIDKIQIEKKYSMHDFDLGFNLRLLHKIGKLKKITIFCVPMKIKKQAALKQLVEKIKKLYPINFQKMRST